MVITTSNEVYSFTNGRRPYDQLLTAWKTNPLQKWNELLISCVRRKLNVCKQLVVAKQHAPPVTALLAGSHGNAAAATMPSSVINIRNVYGHYNSLRAWRRHHICNKNLSGSQFNSTRQKREIEITTLLNSSHTVHSTSTALYRNRDVVVPLAYLLTHLKQAQQSVGLAKIIKFWLKTSSLAIGLPIAVNCNKFWRRYGH